MRDIMLLSLVLSLFPLTLAAPHPSIKFTPKKSPISQRSNDSQHWVIPSMTLHWQSPDTGSREYGPNWPDWAKFDSELNFNLSTPGLDLNCSTLFPLHQLPSAAINCGNLWETEEEAWKDGERVSFKLEKWTGLGERVPELSFLLGIWRGIMDEFGVITTYYAEQAITANDYTEPTTHLYCVLGRPFDGFRCRDNFKPIDFDAVVVKEDVHIWSLKRAN